MNNREIFRKNLGKYIAESGMAQKDIATYLGVNRSTISAWLTGRGYPRADVMQKLTVLFGCEMSDLVMGEQERPSEEDRLLEMFRNLNSVGKVKLLERAEELTILFGEKSANVSARTVHGA